MSSLDEATEILGDLIAFPSVSADTNLPMISHLAGCLESAGARVEIYQNEACTKANLFATIGPDVDGGIILSGHTDVVPVEDQDWSFDPFQMNAVGDLLYGRGACDMKGFIACAVALAPEFASRDLKRPIHFAFTYDEETGCLGARQLMEVLAGRTPRPSLVIIGEPTEMRIIEGHKGCCEYTTTFSGLEGHGSTPDRGVNAVEYAVRYASRLMELRGDLIRRAPAESRFSPPWTTINIGRLSGGVAHNVIAGLAELEWEMRPVQSSDRQFVKREIKAYCDDELLPAMRAVAPDAGIVTTTVGEIEGLQPMDENKATELVAELTGANSTDVVSFGTEAGLYQALGLSAVVCGPGSIDQAHKPDEYVSRDQLQLCLDMLAKLGNRLEKTA